MPVAENACFHGGCWFGLFGFVAEIDLNLIDLADDFACVGTDLGTECVEVFPVVGFMGGQVLFEIFNLDVDFGQADFHMDPYGDDGNQESEQADCLGKRKPEYGVFVSH